MGETTPQIDFDIDYSTNLSLHNWVQQLNLWCVPSFKLGLLGSMYFAGWAFTVIWVPLLADKVGRKWWFTGSVIIVFFTMVGFILSPSLLISIILMFVAGAMNSGRVMVGFVYGQEFLVPYWQVIFGTAFHFIDNSTCLITSFYFDFINNHYSYICFVGVFFALVCSVVMVVFIPESPLWQLKMGKIYSAQVTLHKIMRINGIQDATDDIDKLEQEVKEVNMGLRDAPNVEMGNNGNIRESAVSTGRRSILTANEDE